MEKHKIINSEIKEAISRSGYLIEQRVSGVLNENGYLVAPNHTYLDPVSGKTREIDMQADSTWTEPGDTFAQGLRWSICCECENNMQPIVFFPFEPFLPSARSDLIKCYGMPMKIWQDDKYISLLSFLPFHKFHHYCRANIATQYCSFTKPRPNSKWIATHLEEQHDTFNSLVWAIEHDINQFYKEGWQPPKGDEVEPIYLEFRYPLVVLGGELMEARLGKRGLVIKKTKHIQFVKSLYLSGEMIRYQIDVITEDYLSQYLAIVASEMNKVRRLVVRHKKIITQSINRIVEDTKTAKIANSYKKVLTLEE